MKMSHNAEYAKEIVRFGTDSLVEGFTQMAAAGRNRHGLKIDGYRLLPSLSFETETMTGLLDTVDMPKLPTNQKSFAGIPEAVFLDEIDNFMEQPENENNCEKVLQRLDEQHGKYRFMAFNLDARRRKLKEQIPDLQRSLEMIDVLRKQTEPSETQFLLSDQVFIKTTVEPTKTVCLWLGANVMLEYPLDEAEELLRQNMKSAVANLKGVEHDQDFLRDQITTTEVNMARVYNWGVKKRQTAAKNAATAAS